MQLTMRQTSKMVEKLKDRGLVLWTYDGNGSEGTYVTVTETGEKLFREIQKPRAYKESIKRTQIDDKGTSTRYKRFLSKISTKTGMIVLTDVIRHSPGICVFGIFY
ncbi:MAG: hypothetical protein ACI4EG_12625 [Fusicatenibacter sp.]